MKNMKKNRVLLLAMVFAVFAVQAADFGVTGLKFQQRCPWNGLVDIDFTVMCAPASKVDLAVMATDLATARASSASHVWLLDSTNRLDNLRVGSGKHRLLWDAGGTRRTSSRRTCASAFGRRRRNFAIS